MAIHPSFIRAAKEQGLKPRPLTHRNLEGAVYKREREVEDQVIAVLSLDSTSLVERASINDPKSPQFLKEETIVCLIREYFLEKDKPLVTFLFEILFKRCGRFVNDKFRSLDPVLAKEAYNEAMEKIVDLLLDFNNDRGDYFQVRFWSGIKRRSVDVYRKYLAEQKKRGKKFQPGENEEAPEKTKDIIESAMSPEDHCLCRDGLLMLPEPIRTAYILRYYDGWQIESDDPDEPTISGYFKKTPRMIRKWFSHAEEILSQWREGKERRP